MNAWIEVQKRDLVKAWPKLGQSPAWPKLWLKLGRSLLRVDKAWPRPCPSAVQASCALNSAFPSRPLGFNSGEEGSDSLDTSGEYALAEPGKPRCERPYENGTALVDDGAAEASTEESKTAKGSGTDALGAGPSGSGWLGHSHLAAMLNSALVQPLRCLWFASRRHPY